MGICLWAFEDTVSSCLGPGPRRGEGKYYEVGDAYGREICIGGQMGREVAEEESGKMRWEDGNR